MKIFLYDNNDTILLLKSILNNPLILDKIKHTIQINFLLIDITNKLNWNNLYNRLAYLEILMNNNKYLFYNEKLNKIIFPENFDNRIKTIIINPFEMFKFLRKESDFTKWIRFLGIRCINLFFNEISLSSEDCNNLGKLIYHLINIKEQNLKELSYLKFITFCNKNPKLILDNSRINLKVKEYFGYIKVNLNLGILAKHLIYNKDINIIEFNDNDNDKIINLETQIKEVTKKYQKYKKKYIEIRKTLFDQPQNGDANSDIHKCK
jgi:hypothetical protein